MFSMETKVVSGDSILDQLQENFTWMDSEKGNRVFAEGGGGGAMCPHNAWRGVFLWFFFFFQLLNPFSLKVRTRLTLRGPTAVILNFYFRQAEDSCICDPTESKLNYYLAESSAGFHLENLYPKVKVHMMINKTCSISVVSMVRRLSKTGGGGGDLD